MARGKGGLGRGLDSLFEDAAPVFESEHAAVETLPLRAFALRSSSAFFSFALASKAAVSNGSKNVGFSLS